jgi:hypothetical protein
MNRTAVLGIVRRSVLLAPALLAGCLFGDLLVEYHGPMPEKTGLYDEVVVVREVQAIPLPPNQTGGFYADRVRYVLSGQPHDINRIINVSAGQLQSQFAALNPQVGDTMRISTVYDRTYWAGVHGPVPDWPNGKLEEYPVGFHTLTAIRREGP